MRPTLIIPKHWEYLKAMTNSQFASRNYLTANCELRIANCFGWRYALVQHKRAIEIQHYSDDQLQALSAEEIKAQLQAEIEQHQLQVLMLQEQLVAIRGGNNG